jgi:threonine synthase
LRRSESEKLDPVCPSCGSAVLLDETRSPRPSSGDLDQLPPGVWRYRALLPHLPAEDLVSLGEGGTPLLSAQRLGKELGLRRLLLKDESRNPTGSFIDRGSTVLVSLARQRGILECSCVTTGNLGASMAAYCAKAGVEASIRIQPSTDRGKLYQMLAYGAKIEATPRGPPAEVSRGHSLSVSAGNPYILEGEKTTCFEIAQDLRWEPPDVIVVPVGTGGHLSMTWRALGQLRRSGLIEEVRTRLLGVNFEVPPPASRREGEGSGQTFTELEESEPFFRKEAARSMKESGGRQVGTTESQAVRATGLLARTEGIFAEPASASVIASLASALAKGLIDRDETVVCVVTSAGLKDTKAVARLAKATRKIALRGDYSVARMQIGETKLEILRLLARGPTYGYDLWQDLSASRRISTASVYQHLSELEGLGLVLRSGAVTSRGRERFPYDLTKKGADLLKMAVNLDRGPSPRPPRP